MDVAYQSNITESSNKASCVASEFQLLTPSVGLGFHADQTAGAEGMYRLTCFEPKPHCTPTLFRQQPTYADVTAQGYPPALQFEHVANIPESHVPSSL